MPLRMAGHFGAVRGIAPSKKQDVDFLNMIKEHGFRETLVPHVSALPEIARTPSSYAVSASFRSRSSLRKSAPGLPLDAPACAGLPHSLYVTRGVSVGA